jgi:uncharacterized membrane protein
MEKDKSGWYLTVFFAVLMLINGGYHWASFDFQNAILQLGFPIFFIKLLGSAKILGAIGLLLPQMPPKIKTGIYTGFGFVFLGAVVVHIASSTFLQALVPLILLVLGTISFHEMSK